MRRFELGGLAALLISECRSAFAGAPFWAVAGACALLACWRSGAAATSSAIAAYQVSEIALIGLGVAAIFLAASAAARDRRQAASELVLAKPVGSSPAVVLVRFAALWLSLLAIALLTLAAASVAQLAFAGTRWHPFPYVWALARSVLPLGLAGALGFCLSTIFTTPLASAVAGIYWVVVPLTRPHMAMAFDLTLSQHWLPALLLTLSLLALTGALYARAVRDRQARADRLTWCAVALLAATGVTLYGVATSGDDSLVRPSPILSAIAAQTVYNEGRAPGFWLPDARGELMAMSDQTGHPVLLVFWGPAVPESAQLLSQLKETAAEFGRSGLRCIAVCVDRDRAAMTPFLPEAGSDVIMAWDRGRHYGDGTYWSDSPAAVAYDVSGLPAIYLLDRDRGLAAQPSLGTSLDSVKTELTRLMPR